MGVAYNPRIITDGLVLCLDAGNIKSYPGSGNTWIDLSGNGNDGTLTNGPTFNSDNKGSIIFDGVNDYVTLPVSTIPVGNEITFCLWNYGTTNSLGSVVHFPGTTPRIFNIHLPYTDNILYFDAGDGTGTIANYDRISKSAAGQYQGWVYWCFTKNAVSGVMNVYRNGILWHTGTGKTKTIGTPSSNGTIGQGPNGFHSSYISNASFYSRELSAAEIQQNFQATRGRYGI
jgi:hypothetical protein